MTKLRKVRRRQCQRYVDYLFDLGRNYFVPWAVANRLQGRPGHAGRRWTKAEIDLMTEQIRRYADENRELFG